MLPISMVVWICSGEMSNHGEQRCRGAARAVTGGDRVRWLRNAAESTPRPPPVN